MENSERLKDIAKCLQYHRDGLAQYRYTMSPSAIYLEEQTIKYLEELQSIYSQVAK